MTDDLRRRVEAVERAVTGGETDLDGVADAATLAARLDDVETRLDGLAEQLRELDAATQALRGYLGGVDGVSEDVERRADLALAKAETLERAVFEDDADALAVERLSTTTSASDPNPSPSGQSGSDAASTPAERSTEECRSTGGPVDRHRVTDDGTRSLVARLRDAL